MPRYVHDGKTKVYWVTSISSAAAPTVAELNAGTSLAAFLKKDGLNISLSQNMVDNADLEDTFDAQGVGTYGGSMELTMFRDDTTETAWNLFVYGTNGFIVVRRGIAYSTAWTAAQKCEVYPAQMHEPVPGPTTANEQVTFKAAMAITTTPTLKATVAA
jgi:hypothetical protein